MYGALWRVLPGAVWLRILTLVVVAGAVVSALMLWVFPAILPYVSPQDATVQE